MRPEQFQNVFASIISKLEAAFSRFWRADDACLHLSPKLRLSTPAAKYRFESLHTVSIFGPRIISDGVLRYRPCPSLCPLVSRQFLETALRISYIFCMKLGDHKVRKVTLPLF